MKPLEVTDLDLALGGDISKLMPDYSSIPEEFKRGSNRWVGWARTWFFSGLKKMPEPKEGIDRSAALRHLGAIQGSWTPKHEHKEAAVAYLASQWFDAP